MQKQLYKALIFGLFFVSGLTFAEWYSVSIDSQQGAKSSVQVLASSYYSTVLKFNLEGFELNPIIIDGKEYSQIILPDYTDTQDRGYPQLPKVTKNVMIPVSTSDIQIKVLSIKQEEMDLGIIAPSKGVIMRNVNPEDVSYTFSSFYNAKGFSVYPKNYLKVSKKFILRNAAGINLMIYPFQYNSVTKLTTVLKEIVVEIKTLHNSKGVTLFNNKPFAQSFVEIYQNRFINFNEITKDIDPSHFVQETGGILIISHLNFLPYMMPFVNWKIQKGWDVEIVDVADIGSSDTEIKQYISNKYFAEGISHVILVGDAEFVPYHVGKSGNAYGNEADPLYTTVDGDDSYPDLFVSRLSVKTIADIQNIVNKIVNYEKNPDPYGDWYSKASGIASNEGYPTDAQRAEILREMLEGYHYTYVDKIYAPYATTKMITDALNEGRGFINYIGHGSKTAWVTGYFDNSDIDSLKNGNMLPFIVSVACVNGDFGSGGDAFAERWLKAGSVTEPKGAVAIYASSTNQSWVPPTIGQKEIVNLLVQEKARTIGGLFMNGVIAVLEDNSSTAKQTFETWHIFGDSSMEVRTQKPSRIYYDIPTVIYPSISSIKVYTNPGVRVTASLKGVILATGVANNKGKALLQWKHSLSPGTKFLLTLTGFNKIPYQRYVRVSRY